MRRTVVLLLLLWIWATPVSADEQEIGNEGYDTTDLAMMSTDALVGLRDRIDQELVSRGVVSYFDLELNSKGDDVAKLQTRLAELGYYLGNITGKYDSATRQAEKQFEKANHLENDGVASQNDQHVLFSDSAIPKATMIPKPVATPLTESAIDLGVNPDEYGILNYEDTMRYPQNHQGEKVKLEGKVIQVLGNKTLGFQIRFSISGSSDIVYVYVNGVEYNILENDRMTIYATIKGTKTYTSILKQSITIPSLQADCVILKN